ncbi:uracil-DNA glycosylase [Alkalimonas collagenimarina]|uniref:Uracil-DNA glycosylase n=1 Tax=Alkalimonas collagenimarina TaxID=400390 RepID=A0ABT9H2Z0_9GAMM|nr:uracil-DNA glycosylase [Alkalimonas collagenimarina]MDP4537265.1 uracil-DNA glycosylase [Alkalimonas collagenimarina]
MLDWQQVIGAEKQQPYFQRILAQIKQDRAAGQVIYPADSEMFNAFKFTPFSQLKVVLLGQDPYHGPNQAHGLAFSVRPGVAIPPSLRNMYKELAQEYSGFQPPKHGCLQAWAEQGVLLLNTALSVVANQANSHRDLGWEQFTDQVITAVSQQAEHVVFLLWGAHAGRKARLIDATKHTILTAPHPSPLSAHRGFIGCNHFRDTNAALVAHGQSTIDWQLPAIGEL